MPDAQVVEWSREEYTAVVGDLDERARRRWRAAQARSLGWGGIAAVAAASGLSDRTIPNGIQELDDSSAPLATHQRRSGAGRKSREFKQPELVDTLERLVESGTRGDPISPLRWTCKSTRTLPRELTRQGFTVSCNTVARLLHACGYSLQANRKTTDGKQHPDRDAQLRHISRRVRALQRAGQPAISVDRKKMEPLGKMNNPGRTCRRQGDPEKVNTHDFPDKRRGKAVPYGVYDLTHDEAGVSIGIRRDTADSAVAAIGRWWKGLGRSRDPRRHACSLLPTAAGATFHERCCSVGLFDNWPMKRGWRSNCVTTHRAPASGTKSSVGSSVTSRATGKASLWKPWRAKRLARRRTPRQARLRTEV